MQLFISVSKSEKNLLEGKLIAGRLAGMLKISSAPYSDFREMNHAVRNSSVAAAVN